MWLARIPAVKQHLGLSDGLLGVALLAAPVGLVLVAAVADRLIDRFGSARLTVASGVAVPLLPIAFGLAGSLAVLMSALLAYGVAGGLLDVSMNAQAVRIEREYQRPMITSFHACYSFGGLGGALLGGLFAWAGVGPAATFAAVGVPLAGVAVVTRRGLLPGPDSRDRPPEGRDRPPEGRDRPPEGRDRPPERDGPEAGSVIGAAGRRGVAARHLAAHHRAGPAGAVQPARRGCRGRLERGVPARQPGHLGRVRGPRVRGVLGDHGRWAAAG